MRNGLALVVDLLFRSKLEAAAAKTDLQLHFTDESLAASPAIWDVILIDLELVDAGHVLAALIEHLRRQCPTVPIIGYCSHVETARRASALAAGCSQVLSRSEFVQRLPDLLLGPPLHR